MFKYIGSLFNIERTSNKLLVRIMFVILFGLRLSLIYFPLGDPDFTPLFNWADSVLSNPDLLNNSEVIEIPISTGNIIYLVTILAVSYLCVVGAVIYCGIHIRSMRIIGNKAVESGTAFAKIKVGGDGANTETLEISKANVISKEELVKRIIIFSLFCLVAFLPVMFSVIYLFLIFIIVIPCIIMIPACYLSGDYTFWKSFSGAFNKIRGFYPSVSRDLSLVALIGICASWMINFTAEISIGLYYPLDAFIKTFLFLVVGRTAAIAYENVRVIGGFGGDIISRLRNKQN